MLTFLLLTFGEPGPRITLQDWNALLRVFAVGSLVLSLFAYFAYAIYCQRSLRHGLGSWTGVFALARPWWWTLGLLGVVTLGVGALWGGHALSWPSMIRSGLPPLFLGVIDALLLFALWTTVLPVPKIVGYVPKWRFYG